MAASYPTSIKSFTTKVDNVTDVLAAHVNDIQDEVVALETQLGVSWKGVVQVVNTLVNSVTTGSTVLPQDNTIPQNTEGDQYMSLAITPTNSSNKLLIFAVTYMVFSNVAQGTVALFQDSTANALSSSTGYFSGGALTPTGLTLVHYMTAGTTSATTFKIRAGTSSGTNYFNQGSSSANFGGTITSSITIMEIKV